MTPMLTSTRRRLTIGAIVLVVAGLVYLGYRTIETGDPLAAIGLSTAANYTCGDVLSSTAKAVEVDDAFINWAKSKGSSALQNAPSGITGGENSDYVCQASKPDDPALDTLKNSLLGWALTTYADSAGSTDSSISGITSSAVESAFRREVAARWPSATITALTCEGTWEFEKSGTCDVTLANGDSKTFTVTPQPDEADGIQLTIDTT